ncbi:hypothetical protein STCU_02301 [Strigomonas culicis]|uniref:Uncharacterized protein n=1 Tax=Strigomonas culicis TaxID=28005 RepID=S9UQX1_9TRYP|nr:hypothetical protein STCU_03453 [Strigomonas culicis]EPY33327.1 hypothetical protein STCU_02301 [Strigomonas culicis]|eukprot:EPY31443.1 hypothetical protein STCU_03453 [Strigomonas culicis]
MVCEQLTDMMGEFNLFHIVASAVAQQVFAMAWFGIIVNHLDQYWTAADKGVRRFEHVVHYYPAVMVAAGNFLCCILRSAAVLVVANLLNAKTLEDYERVALVVVGLGLVRVHRHFACQRPVQLLITETGFELLAALLSSFVLYGMQLYQM